MIWDLLDLSNVPNDIIPCKVVELHADELYVIQPNDTACDVVGYDMIEPIPITAEILEKNGFKKTTDEKYYMCDDYSELSAEEYSDSIWLICCSDIECNLPVQKIMVSYIHQLQQFLRLCGNENLANNFKIE